MGNSKCGDADPPELKVFHKIVDQLGNLEQIGYAIVRETATIGTHNGLESYLPYMFFAFHARGSSRNWPPMPNYLMDALRMGRWALSESVTVPNYTREMVHPPPELEKNVDQSLKELANWCWTDLRNKLTVHYFRVLHANLAEFSRATDNPNSKIVHLKNAFEKSISLDSLEFAGGDRISAMIQFLSV